jgi:hypothetical protein
LLGDALSETQHALHALFDEARDAVRLDVALGLEAQLFFRLDLDP